MQISVSGKQVDLSDALKHHVIVHLDHVSERFFDRALDARVTFGRSRSFFTCDINLHAARGMILRAEGQATDAHAAFDAAAVHLTGRLRRQRQRMSADHIRTGTRQGAAHRTNRLGSGQGAGHEAPAP